MRVDLKVYGGSVGCSILRESPSFVDACVLSPPGCSEQPFHSGRKPEAVAVALSLATVVLLWRVPAIATSKTTYPRPTLSQVVGISVDDSDAIAYVCLDEYLATILSKPLAVEHTPDRLDS